MFLKKLGFTFRIFTSLSILSVLMYACCGDERYRLVEVESSTIQDIDAQVQFDSKEEALITGQFYVYVNFEMKQVAGLHDLNPITLSHAALDCLPLVDNPLQTESLSIYFNRDFLLGEDTVKAGASINNLKGIEIHPPYSDVAFFARNEFMAEAQFTDSLYTLNVEVADSKGQLYAESWTIRFDLN